MVIGLENFRQSLEIVDKNNIYARNLTYSVQTNATLINPAWCRLFSEYQFSIGVSMDGPQLIHDSNRVGWTGKGSYSRALRGIEHLQAHGIKYVGICVLTDYSLDYPDEIFDFFVDHGFASFGFNSEEIEAAHTRSTLLAGSTLKHFSQVKRRYVQFMTRIVERWIQAGGAVQIRELEHQSSNIALRSLRPSMVPMQDVSSGMKIITVRADGALLTFSPELASGTLEDKDAFVVGHVDEVVELEDICADLRYQQMRTAIRSGIEKCRQQCDYFGVCGGGWPSNKYFENGTFDCAETRNCSLHIKSLTDVIMARFARTSEFQHALQEYYDKRVAERQVTVSA